MTAISLWWQAARPKTLGAGASPVILGLAFALRDQALNIPIALITLFCALLIQVGTNYANDYFDAKKGSDTADRKGPTRLTQAGLVSPSAMKSAFIICFTIAFILGLVLALHGGWIILLIGVCSILFGILYTATPYALAYNGLGDVFVLAFFGPIAVAGTYFLQTGLWSIPVSIMGLGIGLYSVALLIVNNIRDYNEDRIANKNTLVVRLGIPIAKAEYLVCLLLPLVIPIGIAKTVPHYSGLVLCLFTIIRVPGHWRYLQAHTGSQLNSLLAQTGQSGFIYTCLASAGMLLI